MYCNVNTKKCSPYEYALYKYTFGCSPPCCRKHVYTCLKYTDEILRDNGIKYWLMGGGLLGAIRDKDLVKITDDTDIAIMEEDVPRLVKLSDQFAAKGMRRLKYCDSGRFTLYQTYISQTNHNCIDLFIYKEGGNGMVNLLKGDPTFSHSFRKDDISNLEKARVRDAYFPVPSNTTPYFLRNYGEGWVTPLKINTLGFDPPPYDSSTPYIDRFSEDIEERKKWARLFLRFH